MLCSDLKWMLIFCPQITKFNITQLLNMAFKSFITLFTFNLLDFINSEEGRLKYLTLIVILTIFSPNISYSVSFLKGIHILMLFCPIYESLYLLHLFCILHVLSLSSASLSDNFPVVQLLCRVRLFATAWTIAHQVLLSMGFPRQEYWSRLSFSSPGDLPNPGIKHVVIHCQVNSLTTEPPGKHDHLPGFCQNFSLSTISFATFAFVRLPFAWNSSVHPFIFNHSMAFLVYLLCQSDTARDTPFFLSMRTLGNTSRPKENTSRHTVQLSVAIVSMCGQWEVHRRALWDFGRAPEEGEGASALLLFILSFLLIWNEDWDSWGSQQLPGTKKWPWGWKSHVRRGKQEDRGSQRGSLMTESCQSAWTTPWGPL